MTLRQKITSILIIAITFCIMVGTVISAGLSTQYEIKVGEVCPEDIYATRNIIDIVTTQEKKTAAENRVADVYIIDPTKVEISLTTVKSALSVIDEARNYPTEDATAPEGSYLVKNSTYLPDAVFDKALELTEEDFNTVSKNVPLILREIMTEGVADKTEGTEAFATLFSEFTVSDPYAYTVAEELCGGAININKTLDQEETLKQKEAAASAVTDVTYMKNQVIARRGEIITEAQYAMLKELGFVKGSIQIDIFHTISVVSLLVLAVGLVILYYVTLGKREITTTLSTVLIICSVLTVAGALIILFGVKSDNIMIYVLPLSLIPALISLLLSANLACAVNIITAVLAGIQTNDLSVTLSIIIAGAATAYVFSRVRRRTHLLYATTISAFAYALSYSAIFIDTSKSILDVFVIFSYALLGNFFGGILTIGTLPFWEAIFDVITPMKLGELSNPEHKLLKKLLLKAPGSYHHSLTVANMADAAASAINANALLARVGAYYHDIGKIENPMFFKENQFAGDNPHDELSPEESAEVLLRHVSDGARLASQYRLPSAVKDIIAQHHGTTTTSYFLYKARQENPDVDPASFTYPGPTPGTKEATIIMLADACEAAVRAMREKGNADAKEIVDNIVSARITEGQLANSQLTFSDLEKVKASFVKTLDQYFHKRIIYPQNEKKD